MSDDVNLLPPSACPSGRHKVNIRVISMEIHYKPVAISNIIIYGKLDELAKKIKPGEFSEHDHTEVVESCCEEAARSVGMEVNLYD